MGFACLAWLHNHVHPHQTRDLVRHFKSLTKWTVGFLTQRFLDESFRCYRLKSITYKTTGQQNGAKSGLCSTPINNSRTFASSVSVRLPFPIAINPLCL